MQSFQYQSLTATGQTLSGTITANDRASAVRQLTARGEVPTSIEATGGSNTSDAANLRKSVTQTFSKSARPTLRKAEITNLIREIATALEAGLPLMSSLKTVRRQASGKAMPVILDHLIERVEAGAPLHQAAKEYGPPFDDMMIGMLRAADASGEMSGIMHQLADLLERSLELRRNVIGATLYPMIVAVLIVASAVLLVTYLVPNLIEPLADQIELPFPTKVVLGVAGFLSSYGLFILAAIIVGILAWRAWLRVPENKLKFHTMLLRIPVYGQLIRDVAVARFTRTLGTLTTAGLSILEGLKITRDTLGNEALKHAIDNVHEQVTTGRPLAEPLEESGLFPPLLIQIVNLGERSGRLEQMLLHAASAFDRQVQQTIKIFTAMLPPALLVVMALLGGFILAAILLPLLEIQGALAG